MSRPVRPTWDDVWMAMAEEVGQRSRCSRGAIGCVIVSSDNQVISVSYVGPAPNFKPAQYPDDRSMCTAWCPRSQPGHQPEPGYIDCVSSHAEQNAVSRADFSKMKGGTVYVNGAVCLQCSKLLTAAGVARVVMLVHPEDAHRQPDQVIKYLKECGLVVNVK